MVQVTARSALAQFKSEDEVAVMVYSGGETLVDGFTRDRDRTLAAIGKSAEMTSGQPAHFNEGGLPGGCADAAVDEPGEPAGDHLAHR